MRPIAGLQHREVSARILSPTFISDLRSRVASRQRRVANSGRRKQIPLGDWDPAARVAHAHLTECGVPVAKILAKCMISAVELRLLLDESTMVGGSKLAPLARA